VQKKRHFDVLEPRYSGADEMRRGDGSIRSHCEIPSGSSSPFDTRPIPAPHSHAQVGTSPFSSLVNFNEGYGRKANAGVGAGLLCYTAQTTQKNLC